MKQIPKFWLISVFILVFNIIEYIFFIILAKFPGSSWGSNSDNVIYLIFIIACVKILISTSLFFVNIKVRFLAIQELSFRVAQKIVHSKLHKDKSPSEMSARCVADVNSTVNIWLYNKISMYFDIVLMVFILLFVISNVKLVLVLAFLGIGIVFGALNFYASSVVKRHGSLRRNYEERRLALMAAFLQEPQWLNGYRSRREFDQQFSDVMLSVGQHGSITLFGQGFVKIVIDSVGIVLISIMSVVLVDYSSGFQSADVLVLAVVRLVPLVSKVSVARQAISSHSVAADFVITLLREEITNLVNDDIQVNSKSINFEKYLIKHNLHCEVLQFKFGKGYWLRGQSGVGKTRLIKEIFKYTNNSKNLTVALCPQKPIIFDFHVLELLNSEFACKHFAAFELGDIMSELGELKNEKLSARLTSLSVGESQRIALLYSLVGPENVLLLDEPFSAIDTVTIDSIQATLKAFCQSKLVIIVSHVDVDGFEPVSLMRAP